MGANYLEEWDTNTQGSDTSDTFRNLSSTFVAFLAGAYLLFKLGEQLGFPVWLWLHQSSQMLLESPPVRISLKLPVAITNRLRGHDPSETPIETDPSKNTEMQKSGASMLGSMFGLNSSGFLKKSVSGLTGALSKSYSSVPPGLGNISNSCYQNSIVQGLASLPALRDYLLKTTSQYQLSESETTTAALFSLINKLNDPESYGHKFWISGVLKSMSTWQQQDAQEYYSKVLDSLEKEVLKCSKSKMETAASWLLTAKSLSDLPEATGEEQRATGDQQRDPSIEALDGASDYPHFERPVIPSNPLNGLQAQRVGCINCGYTEGLSMTPFTNLTVPLGRDWAYDIRECLDEVTNLEAIEGVECAKCTLLKRREELSKALEKLNPTAELYSSFMSRLQVVQEALEDEDFEDATIVKKCMIPKKSWVKSTKSRQAVIARAPKALVLHVNRSVFDEYTGAQLKNSAQIHFPKLLDLGPWCLGNHPATDPRYPDESIEEWPRDPRKSMLRGAVDSIVQSSPFQYDLRAVVTHYGRHENGHYIAYRRNLAARPAKPAEDEGNQDSNLDATEAGAGRSEPWWQYSDDDVSAVSEELVLNQGGVFMLFYERIDSVQETAPAIDQGPVEPASILPPATITPLDEQFVASLSEAIQVSLPDDDSDSDSDSARVVLPSPPLSPAPSLEPTDLSLNEAPEVTSRAMEAEGLVGLDPARHTLLTPPPDDKRGVSTSAENTTPDMYASETDTAGYDSEDAPSTQLTSDDEQEPSPSVKGSLEQVHFGGPPPHTMRAGDTPRRGNGSQASLPMVTAGY